MKPHSEQNTIKGTVHAAVKGSTPKNRGDAQSASKPEGMAQAKSKTIEAGSHKDPRKESEHDEPTPIVGKVPENPPMLPPKAHDGAAHHGK
jgi:hypothetical protein